MQWLFCDPKITDSKNTVVSVAALSFRNGIKIFYQTPPFIFKKKKKKKSILYLIRTETQ